MAIAKLSALNTNAKNISIKIKFMKKTKMLKQYQQNHYIRKLKIEIY